MLCLPLASQPAITLFGPIKLLEFIKSGGGAFLSRAMYTEAMYTPAPSFCSNLTAAKSSELKFEENRVLKYF